MGVSMFRDSYIKRINKIRSRAGVEDVQFRLKDGSIFSIPKKRVMKAYIACFNGEISPETTALLQATGCTAGEGRMYTLCQMMQEQIN
jgi:hypothetical protein